MDDLITVKEAADICHASPETVRYWHYAGKGPTSFKVGRRRLYKRADVLAWLEGQYKLAQTQAASL